jgi:hypothetical protein
VTSPLDERAPKPGDDSRKINSVHAIFDTHQGIALL